MKSTVGCIWRKHSAEFVVGKVFKDSHTLWVWLFLCPKSDNLGLIGELPPMGANRTKTIRFVRIAGQRIMGAKNLTIQVRFITINKHVTAGEVSHLEADWSGLRYSISSPPQEPPCVPDDALTPVADSIWNNPTLFPRIEVLIN